MGLKPLHGRFQALVIGLGPCLKLHLHDAQVFGQLGIIGFEIADSHNVDELVKRRKAVIPFSNQSAAQFRHAIINGIEFDRVAARRNLFPAALLFQSHIAGKRILQPLILLMSRLITGEEIIRVSKTCILNIDNKA